MNSVKDTLNQLIQKHQEYGEIAMLFWSLGQEEEYYNYMGKANGVWEQFMELYYA